MSRPALTIEPAARPACPLRRFPVAEVGAFVDSTPPQQFVNPENPRSAKKT